MFNGDWHLALASYNGGPGRVQRAMKRGGVDDFWALAAKPKLLPRETRDYVPMILAAIVIARNPAQYGFEFEAERRRHLRHRDAAAPGRSSPRRRVDRHDDRRDPGAQSRAAPLDHAGPGCAYELKVPAGTADCRARRNSRTPRRSSSPR